MSKRHKGPCGVCGVEIITSSHGGYVHDAPLSAIPVSSLELACIVADPPTKGAELGRKTYLHEARP